MLFRQTDIPFSSDEAHRFLPWLIGIMAGLAALFLSLGISVNYWMADRHISYSGGFTVNIPAGENQDDQAARVLESLKKTPGVAKASQMDASTLKNMLKPWIGNDPMDDLPLPVVIEARLDSSKPHPDYAKLERTLSELSPGVKVDAQERWVASFSRFSFALRVLSAVLALMIIGGMAMTIAFSARAALKMHGRTVNLLHAIGAEDDYIMRQFQQEALRVALPGAVIGCLAAGLIYWALGAYIASLQISLVPPLQMTFSHILLFLILPLACGFTAWTVVRYSISLQLARIL